MKPRRRVFVVGGGQSDYLGRARSDFVTRRHPDYGKRQNPGLEEHLSIALGAAFAASGVPPEAVGKAYVGNFLGERFVDQAHLGAMLPRVEPRLDGIPIARMEAACASGGVAIGACIDALQAGVDVALAAGVEIETTCRGAEGVGHVALAAHHATERGLDPFTFPYLFARRARAYQDRFGATADDLARVAVKAYGNARRNPQALHRETGLTFDQASTVGRHNKLFLEDEALRPYIRTTDCTAFTDGASAVLLATEDGLERLGIPRARCTEIVGFGHTVAPLGGETDPAAMSNVARAAKIAYADADIGPADVELAEVHDCFTISELQMYEALGLCPPGGAPRMLADGETAVDGRLPVNPGGGLLGAGHPIGATGIRQVVEIWRQMKGRCGDYQVPRPPRIGLTANLGGDDRTGVVMVHRDVS